MTALTVAAQAGLGDTAVFGPTLQTWLLLVLAAFVGGAFGAAVGALPAFGVTGVLVVAGEAATLLERGLSSPGVVTGPDALSTGITGTVALGPIFGPHVSFAGGAAAAAYATRKGYADTGFEYYAAKNVAAPLWAHPNALVVGGLFGILGLLVTRLSTGVVPGGPAAGLPWDPIAFGVVLAALFHRVVLGFPLVGRIRADGGVLDMSPFDPDVMQHAAMGSEIRADGRGIGALTDRLSTAIAATGTESSTGSSTESSTGAPAGSHDAAGTGPGSDGAASIDPSTVSGRLAVEPWQPRYYEWLDVAAVGVAVGVVAALLALVTGSAFLAFGLSAASLFGLVYGVENVPVTHHVALPASTAALAVTAGSPVLSLPALGAGALFGLGGALVGELAQRVVYAHGDTHVDPPAVAIVVTTLAIAVLAMVGVFASPVWIPVPGTV